MKTTILLIGEIILHRFWKNESAIALFLVFVWIVCSVIAFFYLPSDRGKDFASFMSGFSTLGILVLTAFYVVYTNRQIRELQKQRQLQIQPLPNIEIVAAAFTSPKIVVYPPPKIGIRLVVDLHFRYRLKNVGNGAAVLVDTFSYLTGKEIRSAEQEHSAQRYAILEVGEEAESSDGIRDENCEAIRGLNKGIGDDSCTASQAFDVLLRFNALYRNILGSAFLLELLHIIGITDDDQKELANWIAAFDSFEKTFAHDISQFKAVTARSRREGLEVFEKIKKEFQEKCPPRVVPVDLLPLPQTFDVRPIEPDVQKALVKKIHHAIPLGRMAANPEEEENKAWEARLKKRYFGLKEEDGGCV